MVKQYVRDLLENPSVGALTRRQGILALQVNILILFRHRGAFLRASRYLRAEEVVVGREKVGTIGMVCASFWNILLTEHCTFENGNVLPSFQRRHIDGNVQGLFECAGFANVFLVLVSYILPIHLSGSRMRSKPSGSRTNYASTSYSPSPSG
jgi:hypothetical protein